MKFPSMSMALLRLVQNIYDGFKENDSIVDVFIDMEKAFDPNWRNGLLHKLYNMGVKGRMWDWLYSFLHQRKLCCYVQGATERNFLTKTGLPQGSVLSPMLFCLFIANIHKEIWSQSVKFADDGTVWRIGSDIKKLADEIEVDFEKMQVGPKSGK